GSVSSGIELRLSNDWGPEQRPGTERSRGVDSRRTATSMARTMTVRFVLGALLLLGAACLPSTARAQLLNIEKKRLERPDDDYVVGNLGVNFAYNNRSPTLRVPARVLTTGLTSNVGYFSDHTAYMLMSDYQLLRINENSVVDTGVTHL